MCHIRLGTAFESLPGEMTQSYMQQGAVVHSASPSVAERPQRLYLESWETSVWCLRRMSSDVGSGASHSLGGVSGFGYESESSSVEESDFRDWFVVMDCVPVSAMTRTRSGALWRASPPFAVLRIMAWTSCHAAL